MSEATEICPACGGHDFTLVIADGSVKLRCHRCGADLTGNCDGYRLVVKLADLRELNAGQ
jgi:RNA polymerase subunit RPABC4/transcription elongation factor Spt4